MRSSSTEKNSIGYCQAVDLSTPASEALEICKMLIQQTPLSRLEQETLFSNLDLILNELSDDNLKEILKSASFQKIKNQVHIKRATYEFEREMLLAQEIIQEHSSKAADQFRSRDWYSKALSFETEAVAQYKKKYGCKNILFIGSGPFPTSPMAFLKHNSEAQVTCIEKSAEACNVARQVAQIYGLPGLKILHSNGMDPIDFINYDCVIVGLVVGTTDEEKKQIAEHFFKTCS